MLNDLTYDHPSNIHVLRPAHSNDARDLIAVAGESFVDVIQITAAQCTRIASFHIGARITALAWSSSSVSPATSDAWVLELAAASSDFGLHLLTKSPSEPEHIFPFGGGLSGHHAKITDMVFCGGWDEDSARYLATVSDDKMLMVWDLNPPVEPTNGSPPPRSQPMAYVIPFPHPLACIRAHPSTSKEFLVADCRGSIFLTDWRSDPEDHPDHGALRHSSLVELVDPSALALPYQGASLPWPPSIDWRADNAEVLGGVFGTKFSLWDISKLRGTTPSVTGNTFSENTSIFRWCRTYPEYFAISVQSPADGPSIHIHNCNYVQAAPDALPIAKKPLLVQDFDFLSLAGIPRIAAAVGNTVLIFPIGEDL